MFFEKSLLPRGDNFYAMNHFESLVRSLIDEQKRKEIGMYLIYNEEKQIVGRINLTSIESSYFKKAEVGYRIAEKHQGKGYATKALSLIIEEAKNNYRLHRLEAGTSITNIGSQIVLIKNNFQFAGRYHQYIQQGKAWTDSLLFERILD